ncbi:kinase [Brevibacillus borstelensis]|uniref:GHMP family kinase ATP-binding protein n=1 Tax=Brevibacillus borstelensis TaxID=45462 RepID=UPI00203E6DB0|nr:kinase [Brevibacillus borstelensis]MCM3557046.1 kinase [Brevibacillus borstelensis]MCM3590037.1 kinase [Brevibacillus borstelensis]MCM3623870.1 kinase [Brevibacillus borstelensis]
MSFYTQSNPVKHSLEPKMLGRGSSYGTFGELLQGVLEEDNSDFLVTFPINRYAHALFVPEPESDTVSVYPSHKQKSRRLAEIILDHFSLPKGATLKISGNIPVGKGLASSSADLVATARAITDCYSLHLPVTLLEMLFRQIEPTDGVMYPGVVSFYHRRVQLRESIGKLSPLTIVSIDEGGEVDTVEFNKLPKPFTAAERQKYQSLLDTITIAIRQNDLASVGKVSTESALLNQKLRPKRTLDAMLSICEEIDALGVCVAHSGTCLGLLLSPESSRYEEQLTAAGALLEKVAGEVVIYQSWSYKEGWDNHAAFNDY